MFFNGDKIKAQMYYLYMMSDGDVSANEEKIFDKICKELYIENYEKETIIKKCKELVEKYKSSINVIKEERLAESIGISIMPEYDVDPNDAWAELFEMEKAEYECVKGENDKIATPILWNFICLGYADQDYSAEEREIVDFLINKWNISQNIIEEMLDTSETALALTKEMDWIGKNVNDTKEKEEKINKIETAIKDIYNDIQISIDELDY